MAAYLLVVTALSALLHQAGGTSVAVAASGIVALLATSLRTRLQRSVDQTLYGARADPYASVASLSQRLGSSVSPDDVLPAVVRTITEELQLPYAAFRLRQRGGEGRVVERGAVGGDMVRLPIEYLGAVVGELVVSTRGHGVRLRPAERRLLTDLARQSGPAAHGVATVVELRRSREQLVAAREEERRALRRELHDDLGATLTGVALGLDALGTGLPPGSAAAAQLSRVRGVVTSAVTDLRRLIEGLRPPALDELGLVPAVRHRVIGLSPEDAPAVRIDADALPPLPPAVEVAAYHVAVEAVHNAVRHAAAAHVGVVLAGTPDRLELTICDDGHGIRGTHPSGDGLSTMRQRVEEVGGLFQLESGETGTTVGASFPLGGSR